MAGHSAPNSPGRLTADSAKRAGGPMNGWFAMGRHLMNRLRGDGLPDVIRIWAGAQDAVDLPLAIRVRAATAFDPFRR